MRRTLSDDALRLSAEFVRRLWTRDVACCQKLLGRDFSCMGAGSGAPASCLDGPGFLAWMETLAEPAGQPQLMGESYEVRSCSEWDSLVVGRLCGDGAGALPAGWYGASLLWRRGREGLRLSHLHLSPAVPGDADQVSGAYAGLLRMLSSGCHGSEVVLRDADGSTHFLDSNAILYLEAERQYTVVHTLEGDFRVAKVLGRVQEDLPGEFLRVHRGFVINIRHVAQLRPYTVVLSGGAVVPLPERRAAAVRESIAQARGALG